MNNAIAAALLQVNVDIGFDPAVNLVGSFLTTLIVGFAVSAAGFGAVLDGWL